MHENKQIITVRKEKTINMKLLIDNNPVMNDFKRKSKVLYKKLKAEYKLKSKIDFISLSQCQDLVAQQHGYKHWHEFYTNVKSLYLSNSNDDMIKYSINGIVPTFKSHMSPINLGYSNKLGLQTWIDRGSLLNHVYIEGNNKQNIELSLIKQIIENGDHLLFLNNTNTISSKEIEKYAIKNGREKDIRVISFSYDEKDKTNWFFPKNLPGGSGGLTELLISLMDEGGSDGDMWKGRAISLISAIMMPLTYMRDNKEILLTFETINNFLILENIISLYKTRRDFPTHICSVLRAYLVSLPEFDIEASKQNDKTIEQHGYLQMIFAKILLSLMDYNYLFKDQVNLEDSSSKMEELLGIKENLIFIVDFSKILHHNSHLFYFFIGILHNSMAKLLGEEMTRKKSFQHHNIAPKFIFINDCQFPLRTSAFYSISRALNTALIISENKTINQNDNEDYKTSNHCQIKLIEIDKSNDMVYQHLSNNLQKIKYQFIIKTLQDIII